MELYLIICQVNHEPYCIPLNSIVHSIVLIEEALLDTRAPSVQYNCKQETQAHPCHVHGPFSISHITKERMAQ